MADVKKIRVDIDGNARGLKQATSQANKSLNTLGGSAKKLGGVLAGAFAGTAIIAGMGRAINKIAEFEATMRRVALISKGSEKELSNLAQTLGSTTVFTANQAGEAMTFLAQAGFDANQIMKATPGVLELAASTMIDLGSAADIASNVLSAYGMEASEINKINDLLVTTTNNANTNVLQFAEAFKVAGPIAKGAGIEINDLAGLIGVLGDAGIQGSLAGTQLKTAIAQLISPMSKAQKVLDDLNVSTRDSNGELRPLIDIFRDLGKSGMTAEQAFAIFEKRAASGALVMAGAADKAEDLSGKTKEVGVASSQAEAQLDTLQGDIKLLASAWEGLVLEGGRFNIIMRKTIQMVTQLVSIMGEQSGQIDSVTASLIASTDSISSIESLINTFTMLQDSIGNTDYQNQQYAAGIEVLKEKLKAYREEEEERIKSNSDASDSTDELSYSTDELSDSLTELVPIGWEFVSVIDSWVEKQQKVNQLIADGKKALDEIGDSMDVSGFADDEEVADENPWKSYSQILEEVYQATKKAEDQNKKYAIAQATVNKELGINKRNAAEAAAATAALAAANGQSAKSIIAAALAVAVAESIKGSIFAAKNPILGLILAGVAVAGVKAMFNNIPEFARGTSFAPGGTALVGENGPEVVSLPRGASVTPNHLMGSGGGGGDIVLKLNEYEFARVVNIATANQGNNVARTTF